MLFSGLWKMLGADVEQLHAILDAKLKIDNRKPISFGANKGRGGAKKKERRNTIGITMLLSLLSGLLYIFPIIITIDEPVLGLALFYTIFTFFFTFTLITDFANILIDTKDKIILFSRPINDETITLSRLLYIAIYLFRMGIPMAIPAWILFAVIKGWVGALWFPFPLLLNIFVVLLIVCGIYLTMIRLAGPRKFKDVLNYFQIAFSMIFFAWWMLSSRMIDPESLKDFNIAAFDWAKYVPTYWLATSWSWVDSTAKLIPGTKWLSILAIIFPLVSLWATVKWLAPQFSRTLAASDIDDSPIVRDKTTEKTGGTPAKLYNRLAGILNKTDTAKAGFIITWLQTSRNRNFKMRVYPTFAYVPVYFFFILMNNRRSFSDVWDGLAYSNKHIALLYMTFFVVIQALTYVTMSDQYKAAWVYYAAPVEKPGEVIAGAFKAIWAKFFLPFMLAIGVFVIVIWGTAAAFDVILATINISLFSAAMMRIAFRVLPFSKKEQIKDSGVKSVIRVFGSFALIAILGFTHYAVTSLVVPDSEIAGKFLSSFNATWLTILSFSLKVIFLILSSVFLWLVLDSLKNTTWQSMKKIDADL